MNNFNHDTELEKRIHPENFETDSFEEAGDLIDIVADAVQGLSYWSVRNDDLLNSQIQTFEETIKDCRKQLV